MTPGVSGRSCPPSGATINRSAAPDVSARIRTCIEGGDRTTYMKKGAGVVPRPFRTRPGSALDGLVYRSCTAADRGSCERALLAADRGAHAGTGRRGTADDQRGLAPRSLLTRRLTNDDALLHRLRRRIHGAPCGHGALLHHERRGGRLQCIRVARLQAIDVAERPGTRYLDELSIHRLNEGRNFGEGTALGSRAHGIHRHA